MSIIYFLVDFILHVDVYLTQFVTDYGLWTYGLLFLIVFCETGLVVTPFLPGDSLLFLAGTLSAQEQTGLNPHYLFLSLLVAAIIGDAVNYTIGKFFGERLFSNPDSKIFRQSHLQKTHDFFEKYGGKTIIIARFIPIVRTFAPFVAGMAHMSYARFALFNVSGALLWVGIFIYAGYGFGNVEWVQKNLKLLIVGIIFVSILPAIIEILRHKLRARKAA